ncbi:MAG: carbohydrate porin [Cyanobacteria bacterium SID2]|nr:carbohydrate porin [Cyanobacteria bacterium SID2]MBP0006376.1 carbohydrate porin [Cyanobacteria bacterium SBC]
MLRAIQARGFSTWLLTSSIVLQVLPTTAAISPNRATSNPSLVKNDWLAINSVDELSDVSPSHWARQALNNLIQRYGCIAGYPNGNYEGNRTMTRYEFASALNTCLNTISEINLYQLPDDSLQQIARVQQDFANELAVLRRRVDSLEMRVQQLEDQQFSTTTKLNGEASFSLSSVFGEERADGGDLDEIPVLDNRVRLSFETSFTGEDLLILKLDALSVVPFGPGEEDEPNVTGTNMTRTAHDEGSDNEVVVDALFYQFSIGDDLFVTLHATGGEFEESAGETFNEFFEEEFNGAISRFGRFNPIYYLGEEGAGVSLTYEVTDAIEFSIGYLAPPANDPSLKNGLFNGSYAALAQLGFEFDDGIEAGLTYVRSYFPGDDVAVSGETGSELANAPFGEEIATSGNSFGLQASFEITDGFVLAGWAGLTLAHAETDGEDNVREGDDATIFNWAITLAFPDLGSEGSLGGIIIGQPPRVLENDGGSDENDSSWHLEAQYRYQIDDNIAINPGFFAILNPENDNDNSAIWVGTIRAIFQF